MIPALTPIVEDASITPTPTIATETPTPTPTIVYGGTNTKGGTSSAKNIPATGPADFMWMVLGGSLFAGAALRKLTKNF